jgi:hypothetical protein
MIRKTLAAFLAILLIGGDWTSPAQAQAPESKYFSETGHNVKGEFLVFYNSHPSALLVYGYPITEAFISQDGRTVQYFQRARFEYRPDLTPGQRIQLTALGRETYVSASPLLIDSPFACRPYRETGFSVCFAFLEFFDRYGGTAQFGYPISPFEYHEDKLVQYFERARLEWQPWKPEGQRVAVSDLGRMYFEILGEDPGLLPPVKPLDNTPAAVLTLRVRAFVWKAVTHATDSQTVFVITQDQSLAPVQDAACTATIHWPGGQDETIQLTTKRNGFSALPLAFTDLPYGSLVLIDVSCIYGELNGMTRTSFRIWY